MAVPSLNDIMQEYIKLENRQIPEYNGVLHYLRHRASGAQIISLQNHDHENFFCFGFCTPPLNNHGTAHILEHTVLCGSQKYPVKDPFLLLLRGSMQSFLNAMTYPDRTLYPAASPLEKDFFNLMAVYSDAVFFPQLRQEAFWQEGHKLVLKGRGLRHSGVVYNEMKGVYSSHENFASDCVTRSLFPTTCYQFDSGGDPQYIPQISWQELKDFHACYYHPANCCIFLYGHIPLEEKLEFLHTKFLHAFDSHGQMASVAREKDFEQRRRIVESFAAPAGDSPLSTASVNWRLSPVWEKDVFLKLETLNHLLLGSNGAPFYYALQNSHLGEDVSPISGMVFDFSQAMFTAALRQVSPQNENKVEDLVYKTLRDIVQQGIPTSQVQAALSSVEFSRREIRSGSLGLRLARRLYRVWHYQQDPLSSLFFEESLNRFKKEASQPGYFEQMIQKDLLDNPNGSTVITKPDFTLLPHRQKEDKKHLKDLYTRLTEEDKAVLKEQATQLHAYQKQKDRDDIVPVLTRKDMPEDVVRIEHHRAKRQGITRIIVPGLSHGVYYWKLAFSLNHLDAQDLVYLPLFCHVLGGVGWHGVLYDEASREIVRSAASFSFSLDSGMDINGKLQLHVIVTLKALPSQVDTAQNVMIKTLLMPDFNVPERLKEIVLEFFNDSKAQLVYAGSSLASLALAKYFSPSGLIDDQWHGVGQLFFLQQVMSSLEEGSQIYDKLITRFERLHREIFQQKNLTISLATDEDQLSHAEEKIYASVSRLPAGPPELKKELKVTCPPALNMGYIAASQVSFVGLAMRGSHYGTKEAATEQILANYLASGPLWEKVRMKGGAYGVQAHLAALDQIFTMTSYRDPHIEETWRVYQDVLTNPKGLTQHKLDQALISLVGREIRPAAIEEMLNIVLRRSFLGIDDTLRQNVRGHLLSSTRADLQQALQRLAQQCASYKYVVIGPEEPVLKVQKKGIVQAVERLP